MASLYFKSEKASKQDAKSALMEHIADNWTGAFTVAFRSDDGGEHIMAIVEVNDTNELLGKDFRSKFDAIWMGWRMIVLKVPIGHIRVFFDK